MHKKIILASMVAGITPLLVFAQSNKKTLDTLIDLVARFLDKALLVIMGVAVLLFVYYVVKYFMTPGDSGSRKDASMYVMWSVIGFFVILSFWGLVRVLQNTFELGNNKPDTNLTDILPNSKTITR